MRKVAFRFTEIGGWPANSPWRPTEDLKDFIFNDGDVIEYAYAAPVVTNEMAERLWEAYCNGEHGGIRGMREALTAALEPDNGG